LKHRQCCEGPASQSYASIINQNTDLHYKPLTDVSPLNTIQKTKNWEHRRTTKAAMLELRTHRIANPSVSPKLKKKQSPRGVERKYATQKKNRKPDKNTHTHGIN